MLTIKGESMPHVVLEYSANVGEHHDIDSLVAAVHGAALDHGLAARDALRTRAVERTNYRVATGEPHFGFVAIQVRIGPGRDDATINSFLEAVLGAAQAALVGSELVVMWSIEANEIDPTKRINRNDVRAWLNEQ